MNVLELKKALEAIQNGDAIVYLRVTRMDGEVSLSELHEVALQETEDGTGEYGLCLDGLDEGDDEENETGESPDGELDEDAKSVS